MKKRNDGGRLRLDSFMETRDPRIKRYYFDALEEEGPGGCERSSQDRVILQESCAEKDARASDSGVS